MSLRTRGGGAKQMDNIGSFDQMMAAVTDIALVTKKYYDECVKAGFSAEQALALTVSFQTVVLGQPRK